VRKDDAQPLLPAYHLLVIPNFSEAFCEIVTCVSVADSVREPFCARAAGPAYHARPSPRPTTRCHHSFSCRSYARWEAAANTNSPTEIGVPGTCQRHMSSTHRPASHRHRGDSAFHLHVFLNMVCLLLPVDRSSSLRVIQRGSYHLEWRFRRWTTGHFHPAATQASGQANEADRAAFADFCIGSRTSSAC